LGKGKVAPAVLLPNEAEIGTAFNFFRVQTGKISNEFHSKGWSHVCGTGALIRSQKSDSDHLWLLSACLKSSAAQTHSTWSRQSFLSVSFVLGG